MPTSLRNLKSLFRILPLESQHTSMCSSSCVCLASIFFTKKGKQTGAKWSRFDEVDDLDATVQNVM